MEPAVSPAGDRRLHSRSGFGRGAAMEPAVSPAGDHAMAFLTTRLMSRPQWSPPFHRRVTMSQLAVTIAGVDLPQWSPPFHRRVTLP